MRRIDYILRNWRYRVVEPHVPEGSAVVDIGGYDGSLLIRLHDKIERGVCIDPLIKEKKEGKIEFISHRVSDKLPLPDSSFDVVTMLAVYEHLAGSREEITSEIFRVLKNGGLALLTVPSSAVDHILKVLTALRMADGMSLEEHEHFDSAETVKIFEQRGFTLKRQIKFQMGLNNLFIFEKEGAPQARPDDRELRKGCRKKGT
jgi:SAM-dependent methyltransferase